MTSFNFYGNFQTTAQNHLLTNFRAFEWIPADRTMPTISPIANIIFWCLVDCNERTNEGRKEPKTQTQVKYGNSSKATRARAWSNKSSIRALSFRNSALRLENARDCSCRTNNCSSRR
mmetsp:Transcript_5806/g.11848  ORF Transcript_5806/g.11848 Transcript_5806/m.11848 type:complete len:118 (-) Transcript_5806:1174-1527(-)